MSGPDRVEMKVDGLAEMDRKLRALGPDIARKGLRSAVGAGARVILNQAKARAPVDTGTLRRALYMKPIREESSDSRQTYFVGVRSGKKEQKKNRDAWYWRLVEFGTEKASAQPFLRPAFEAGKFQALERIKSKLAERIQKFTQAR